MAEELVERGVQARAPVEVPARVPEGQEVAAVPVTEVAAAQADRLAERPAEEVPLLQRLAQRAALPTYARQLTTKR